jgi:hypothetical protein
MLVTVTSIGAGQAGAGNVVKVLLALGVPTIPPQKEETVYVNVVLASKYEKL